MATSVFDPVEAAAGARDRRSFEINPSFQYYAAFLATALVTAANLLLASYAGYWSAAIVYLAAISLSAVWLGSGPVVFEAILTAAAWDFLFIPPRFTFTISRAEDALMLALYFVVSLCSGLATARLRASERLLREQGAQLSAVNSLACSLAGSGSADEILSQGLDAIRQAAGCDAIAILADGGALRERAEDGWEPLDAAARGAARRCFESGSGAGRYEEGEPAGEWHFLPLSSPKGRLGVVGFRPAREARRNESELARLAALVSIVALALSREPFKGGGSGARSYS
jgi:two-component system, OmpR family, sensor histidine kinase KdpD